MNKQDERTSDDTAVAGPRGDSRGESRSDAALRRISEALKGLRYGSVLAIVQDGVVMQIERTEKTRLDR